MGSAGEPDPGHAPAPESVAWRRYYDAVAGRPPWPTLLDALARFAAEGRPAGFAVDLGCGDGRDTVELLRRGWRVLAVDAEPAAVERLLGRPEAVPRERLEARVARFEATTWPAADLVNAGFVLPFCPPEAFPGVWARIVGALRPGGRFCGQLFGDRDAWAGLPGRTHHTRAGAEALLAGLAVERFEEAEEDGQTALGQPKHWHVFHIVARKQPPSSSAP